MKHIKIFEQFFGDQGNDINIILDTSGSSTPDMIIQAIRQTDFGNYNNINLIKVTSNVYSVETIKNIDDILDTKRWESGGSDLQPAIDYIMNNNLEKNKTFIISDFQCAVPDYKDLLNIEQVPLGPGPYGDAYQGKIN